MGQHSVQAGGQTPVGNRGFEHRCAQHPGDPGVARPGDVQNGIFVRVENPFDFLPDLGPGQGLGLAGYFLVAFQQLDAHPSERQPFQGKPSSSAITSLSTFWCAGRMEGFCGW